MNKKIIYLLATLALYSCNNDALDPQDQEKREKTDVETSINQPSLAVQGVIRVKLTQKTGNSMTVTMTKAGVPMSGDDRLDKFLAEIKANKMERVFPYSGRYEARTRKEGMHLWYDIHFDKSTAITRATSDARNIPGVDIVEEIYNIERPPHQLTIANSISTRSGSNPFNDPLLDGQWHYNNRGNILNSVVGADINLFKAWEKESGKSNVIVAIVDGGIDVAHEDLKDNMHVNMAELNGTPGVDDDNNGFIDDIYGFNFVRGSGAVTPDDHGTHVAGTVAARNNNGIGVCGVAGGDGTPGSGAKLISCQMFDGNSSGNSAQAIKYGADNGAIISQNSWGYIGERPISLSDRDAIDYFIKYAGCDEKGNQRADSPMKGGVVIFAAGNDDKDFRSYPSAYEPIVSVSAMAPNFKKSYYTNRGDWITIMAPGGDKNFPKGTVLSSVPSNKYGYMQGTSMACPHVSGIAALIASKFGGQGFTNTKLKMLLTTAFRPKDINATNPGYVGRLGKGYIDADKALATNQNKRPGDVSVPSLKVGFQDIEFSWKAVADEDDGTAATYRLYYSDKIDFSTGANYTRELFQEIPGYQYKPGDLISHTLKNLSLNTKYHFALVAEDRWGLSSKPAFFSASTKENFAPIVTLLDKGAIRITGDETRVIKISIKEPEEQQWELSLSGNTSGVSHTLKENILTLTFRAVMPVGKHNVTITVTDPYAAKGVLNIPFEIYENHPPKLIKELGVTFKPIGKSLEINLSDYFKDEDNHNMTFTVKSNDPSIAEAQIVNNRLSIKANSFGSARISVTATDTQDASSTGTLTFNVCKDGLVYIVYPIPAEKVLHVRLGDDVTGEAVISINSTIGQRVFSKTINPIPENRMVDLDVTNISGGTYILNVTSGGKTYNQTFVKL